MIESYHVFSEILAVLFQLEEFYLAVDKRLALFKKHTDSFLTSLVLTPSAEKLKETQSPSWKMPLSGREGTFAETNRNLSFMTKVVFTLWTLYSRGDRLALCTSTDATAIWSSCIANHISHDISTPPTHSENKYFFPNFRFFFQFLLNYWFLMLQKF